MITYTINFTSNTKATFTIAPGQFDGPEHLDEIPPVPSKAHTSLTLYGIGSLRYGEKVNEDLVHLLEHFCNTTAPPLPTLGQIWMDTSVPAKKTLKFRTSDATNVESWSTIPVTNPAVGTEKDGDIHVVSGVISIRAAGAWKQVFPAVYS